MDTSWGPGSEGERAAGTFFQASSHREETNCGASCPVSQRDVWMHGVWLIWHVVGAPWSGRTYLVLRFVQQPFALDPLSIFVREPFVDIANHASWRVYNGNPKDLVLNDRVSVVRLWSLFARVCASWDNYTFEESFREFPRLLLIVR